MAFVRGANVVTDGLVLTLDAANPKSYVSGGNTNWSDLSGNNITASTASLAVKPTYSSFGGGSIYFAGVTGSGAVEAPTYVVSGIAGPPNNSKLFLSSSITLESWFRPDPQYSGSSSAVIIRAGGGSDEMYSIFWSNSTRLIGYEWYDGTYKSVSTPALLVSTIFGNHIAITKNDTQLTIYFNGLQVSSTTVTAPSASQFSNFFIGNNTNNSIQKFNGDISVVKVYNRALSAAEVLQNYNATKARFGL